MNEILVCCPTRSRPQGFLSMAESFFATSSRAVLATYVDADQIYDYLHLTDWKRFGDKVKFHVGKQVGPVGSINVLHETNKNNHRIFGTATDDSLFLTPKWDEYVIRTIGRIKSSGPNDLLLG